MKTIDLNSFDVVELNSEEAIKTYGGSVALIVAFLIGVLIGYGVYEKMN
jgi:hypothetical protein